jgi:outer membrane receptor protein involved in Fe transport
MTTNINYTYDARYYVDLSYRVDGSSTFGSEKKWAPFWSTGIGWNVHNEKWFQENPLLSILRLKASLGEVGTQMGSGSGANTIYHSITSSKYMNWIGSQLTAWGNPRLTWQTTRESNVGVEFGLFNGRLKGEFNYYDKKTSNLLSTMDLPSSMGLNSYIANVGEVKNRGWELSLSGYPIRDLKHGFTWMMTGQLVYNKNWITKLSDAVKAQTEAYREQNVEVAYLFYEGMPQSAIYAVKSLGIDPSTGKEIYVDRDGNVTDSWRAGDKVYCGQSDPKYRGNFGNVIRYKGWTLNFTFSYYWGGYRYNSTLRDKVEVSINALKSQNVDRRALTDRWMKPGDVTFFKGYEEDATRATSRFVMKDNVLELSSASLQYRWDSQWIRQLLKLQSVTFGLNTSDLFHWGSIKQERGINYPYARNIQGSVKVLF